METRRIGTLEVSVIGLGCNNSDGRSMRAPLDASCNASIASGINFLDTADTYGKTTSEEFIGRALQGRRASVIIATKFGKPVDPTRTGARPEYVRQACNDSLRRLGTDYIDLYQLHAPILRCRSPTPSAHSTSSSKRERCARSGARIFRRLSFARPTRRAVEQRGARFVSVQNHYNMLKRDDETDAIPECERLGISYLPYFPLESGLLTGKYRHGKNAPAGTRIAEGGWLASKFTDENLATIERLIAFAESRTRTLLELATSWLLRLSVVASVIAGATSPEQVKANAAAATWRLTPEDIEAVNDILNGA